ncbi:hypothetical protein [Mycobacterium lepromatosis]|uniref:hypothetical protein n=1 Tax=Mycobacterium lepromatosis TaxID=480418 RepID=UPI0006791170|nr:hypothetical protein [Mycobacterium lepromatosis]
MSQSSDETPTGLIERQADTVQARQTPPSSDRIPRQDVPARTQHTAGQPTQRRNHLHDLVAAILVFTTQFIPWNLYFGVGIPASKIPFWAPGGGNLLSLGSLTVTLCEPVEVVGSSV